jgi:hypothetical protein
MRKKKLVLIYSQGRSGTSILTRLAASNPEMYSGKAESPVLYILIATLALIRDVNNDKKYITSHWINIIKYLLYQWFLITSVFYSFWEAYKSSSLNQLPKFLRFRNSSIVTNMPVLPSNSWDIRLLNELFDLRIISIVRDPLEVLASRMKFKGFNYSLQEHVADITFRHKSWSKVSPLFIKYDDVNDIPKLKEFLHVSLGSTDFNFELLENKIHPTEKKSISLNQLRELNIPCNLIVKFEEVVFWYNKV